MRNSSTIIYLIPSKCYQRNVFMRMLLFDIFGCPSWQQILMTQKNVTLYYVRTCAYKMNVHKLIIKCGFK